jgi:myo-inositol-1(or 4)-monophosphatase
MLNIAVRAAHHAGDIIMRSSENAASIKAERKAKNDFVTEVDRFAEQEIISILRNAYPDHGILAEESGHHEGDDFTWIIDPLDGTTNFLHGFPQYSVSIALKHKGRLEQAVIYDPLRQETFTATRGGGAMLDNRRIRVTSQKSLRGALLGTGFPFKNHQHLEAYLGMFSGLFKEAAGIRRAGSAALDLAYVAAGRLDGFWEIGLKPWDMAAGVLLIREAGGIVTDFDNGGTYLESGNLIAANTKMRQIIHDTIHPHMTEALLPKLK